MSPAEVWIDWATWQASVILLALAAGHLLTWRHSRCAITVRAAAAQRCGLAIGMALLSAGPGGWWLSWGLR